jgi:hypothetical protein
MKPMTACPRYDKRSAPLCPLDPDGRLRTDLPEDRVCRWLKELVKPDGEALIRVYLCEATADQIVQIALSFAPWHPPRSKRPLTRRQDGFKAGTPPEIVTRFRVRF